MIILVLIPMVFVINWETFHGRLSLNSVLLLVLVSFVSGFGLELMYIFLIENIRSYLIYLHGFQLVIIAKRVLEAAKLAYANETKKPITSQKLGCRDFWQIANSVLNKGKSAIPPLFKGQEVLSSASDKTKLFAENFSKNSTLDGSSISAPVFPSRTNLKLRNISVTSKVTWSWLYSSRGYKELWVGTFLHIR